MIGVEAGEVEVSGRGLCGFCSILLNFVAATGISVCKKGPALTGVRLIYTTYVL